MSFPFLSTSFSPTRTSVFLDTTQLSAISPLTTWHPLLSSKENHICTVEAKNHSKSPLQGKEQARDYANDLNSRFIILSSNMFELILNNSLD